MSSKAKRAKADAGRSRAWLFTYNNYTDDDYKRLLAVKCEYIIVGKEIAPETGTPHLQCYVYFKNRKNFAAVSRIVGKHAHLTRAKGTPAQNKRYCSKEGKFEERGVLPEAGKRTDLMDMRDMLKAGTPLHKVIAECRSYQAMRGAELLSKYMMPNATQKKKVEVKWFWGPTGSGKTYTAYQIVQERKLQDDLWVSADTCKWFDGYGGQKAVIFDDIRRDDVSFNFFLRLLDGYPVRSPVKGSFVVWYPDLIIITCPMPPESFCPCTENPRQLVRRISEVREFKERAEQVEEVQVEGSVPGALVPFNGEHVHDLDPKEKKEVIEIE